MMNILIIAVLACLVASQVVKECPRDGRQAKCSAEEAPVCGVIQFGNYSIKETYVNHCFACYLGESHFTVEGKCEDYPTEARFCSPKESKNRLCPKIYNAVCGWFNQNVQCKAYPCAINGGNRCEACVTDNVLYTTSGECPKPI